MSKSDCITIDGNITERLAGGMFRIKLENDIEVIGHTSGKIKINSIKIIPGDKVTCEMSPYDLTKARIVYRYSN